MLSKTTVVSLIIIALLLMSVTLAEDVYAKEDKTKTKDKKEKTKTITRDEKKQKQLESAIGAIESAEDSISEAERRINEARNAGFDVSDAVDALNEARRLLREAREILEEDPQRALVLANRSENMARMAASLAERLTRGDEDKRDETLKEFRELVRETRKIIEETRRVIEEILSSGGDASYASQLLSEAQNLLSEAELRIEAEVREAIRLATQARILAEEALRTAERIREEVRAELKLRLRIEEAERAIEQAQASIDEAELKLSSAQLDENSWRTLMKMLEHAREMLREAREKISDNPEAARALGEVAMRIAGQVMARIEERVRNRLEVGTGQELNLSVSGNLSVGGRNFRVENEVQLTNNVMTMMMRRTMEKVFENGTRQIEIVWERMVIIDNKTLISQLRVLERNGVVVEEDEVIEELNESAVSTILEIRKELINITKIDYAVNVDTLHRGRENLRLRVSGPDGLGARIIVIQLDPDVLSLDGEGDLVVLINNEEVEMAESIYELLLGEAEEPAYLLVRTDSGYQVMIYFPHFSEYIVEIKAIMARILGPILDSQAALFATIAATVAIASIMALNTYRKYASRGRVLKLW